ncbi:MAG: FecR protein [Verrucomicrobiales bacterium]|nr:FecR protein [Verrucomicrobiales bacterium]
MKQFTTVARLLLCLALFSISFQAQAVTKDGKAVVRAVRGTSAKYSSGGGVWVPLKVGTTLQPGSAIQTGAETTVDLFLGQNGPVVRVTPDTTLGFDKLAFSDTGADRVIDTQLNLKSGRILGNVKKLASASRYEIKTPIGVAGIRGTDFDVTVTPLPGGKYNFVVTSISGTIVGAVVMQGTPYTAVINTGETWNPLNPEDQPVPMDKALLAALLEQMQELMIIVREDGTVPPFHIIAPPIQGTSDDGAGTGTPGGGGTGPGGPPQ